MKDLTAETVALLTYLEERGLTEAEAVTVLEHALRALVAEMEEASRRGYTFS